MATDYKQKLLNEINVLPESFLPRFYRVIHIMLRELAFQPSIKSSRDSLRGIWCNIVDESMIEEAKNSLFPYGTVLITRDEKITKSKIVKTVW